MSYQSCVELGALDSLITQFLAKEGEGGGAWLARRVRAAMEGGDIQQAVELLQGGFPELMRDDRLVFKLRRQQFVELAQSGDPQRRQQALGLARKELAPLALNAYPEAYMEFKRSMLALLHSPWQEQPDPAEAARRQLAGMLFRMIREGLGVRDPDFTVLLRYLLIVHVESPPEPPDWPSLDTPRDNGGAETTENLHDICRALLLDSSDPWPLPNEAAELSAARVPEAAVQALRTSLWCEREEAVALLRAAGGDKTAALRNAVQARHFDEHAVRQLAQDYAIFRGLDVPLPSPQEPTGAAAQPSEPQDGAAPMDTSEGCQPSGKGLAQHPAAEAAGSPPAANGFHAALEQRQQEQGPALPAAVEEGMAEDDHSLPPAKIPRAGGRRSPKDSLTSTPDYEPAECSDSSPEAHMGDTAGASSRFPTTNGALMEQQQQQQQQQEGEAQQQQQHVKDREGAETCRAPGQMGDAAAQPRMSERDVMVLVKQLRGLLEEGDSDQVEERLSAVSSTFWADFPDALFLVRRCRFLHLLCQETEGGTSAAAGTSSGFNSTAAALAFARARLSPLAQQHARLQPLLKSCLAAMLPGAPAGLGPAAVAGGGGGSSSTAAGGQQLQQGQAVNLQEAAADASAAVHAALRERFGIREPLLLRLLKFLLLAHAEHFLAQHCKDGFEAELGIPALRGPSVAQEAEARRRRAPRLRGAASAPGLEELYSHMGPIFRQLRRLAGEAAAPLPPFPAAAVMAEEGAGPVAGAVGRGSGSSQGGEGPMQLEAGGAPPAPLDDMEEDGSEGTDEEEEEEEEEEEGGSPVEADWRQRQQQLQAEAAEAVAQQMAAHGELDRGPGAEEEEEEGEGEEGGVEGVSEDAILLTQEFSGLPRGQAIELLLLFGSPQAVMAHLFP